ncbi:Glycerol-3-phosphate ABC transporter, ATP-binding protein UgpC (TC 3.A.1.1.3) [hydrothermal vent metagenome]|uniref:Glycerol-3-phosphate ABC transporter, ATP-binding protein UgpC (TC 3.A.1.1.3) n=1 Tax=hydrothermal vent metagenome TaxID=652676 RepID=A0A3B1E905_9ZZZZ
MAQVTLENVGKHYNAVEAVRDFSLDIADGEFVVLVGPSGCGKSTTLRMIAGLEDITTGTISIEGRVVNDDHPKDRDIAMVFQNYALYPHMTVSQNMAFTLKLRKTPKDEIARRVRTTAAMLGIENLLSRKPRQLSGGQRQRVALGRAIVRQPKAFLFDEPLSNLDAKLRVTTRAELKALHQRLKTTTIYVTHDQEEAMTLGDRIIVMADGVIQQQGTPFEVYRHPINRFVASFIGTPPMNFVEGSIMQDEDGLRFESEGGQVRLRLDAAHASTLRAALGLPTILGLRPQAMTLAKAETPGRTIRAAASVIELLGDQMDVLCTIGEVSLIARVRAEPGVSTGDTVLLTVEPDRLHFFAPGEFGQSLLTPHETAVAAQ